jgi:3-methyladenine DNA glycosylase AlkD
MTCEEVIINLKKLASTSKKDIEGMARFGINVENALCVSMPKIRKYAKEIGKNHELALQVWDSGIHEAKILAGLIDDREKVTDVQMEKWVSEFDSWDVCDQVIMNLFDKTEFAYKKAKEWAERDEEFVKRAGFAMMASLAVHDKKASNELFIGFLKLIKEKSTDERNFVRKAVNWALRQIGKSRNIELYNIALKTAYEISEIDDKTARWIAKDAIRELESDAVKKRLLI